MERIVYTVYDIRDMLGIGLNQAYKLVERDDFPSMKIGTKYVIPKEAFEEWIKRKSSKDGDTAHQKK